MRLERKQREGEKERWGDLRAREKESKKKRKRNSERQRWKPDKERVREKVKERGTGIEA